MRIFGKIFFYAALAVLSVYFLALSVVLFKERIISFIREANKNLNTPVQIGRWNLGIFEFPQMAMFSRMFTLKTATRGAIHF